MDAVDTALVEFKDKDLTVAAYKQHEIPIDLQQQIREFQATASIEHTTELDVILGKLYADTITSFLDSSGVKGKDVIAIGCHGQTVLHMPSNDYPRTLQIADPNIIAFQTGITTVADFRRMDIAAGGQGAPLAPAFHAWYFGNDNKKCILNIGGMANLSVLGNDQILGFDSGPGNALLDDWIRSNLGEQFDKNGSWALSGNHNEELLNVMLAWEYFSASPPKSTGKDEFNLQWLGKMCGKIKHSIEAVDVQATLLQLTANTIATAIQEHATDCEEIIVCGGGYHNRALMTRLNELLPTLRQAKSRGLLDFDATRIRATELGFNHLNELQALFLGLESAPGRPFFESSA